METFIEYLVQCWDARYGFWSTCALPRSEDENMFELRRFGHETEAAALEHLATLRTAHPTSTYRAVRRTTTDEPI